MFSLWRHIFLLSVVSSWWYDMLGPYFPINLNPLLASIEANINYLNSTKGRKKLDNLIENIISIKKDINNIDFGGDDITKILIKKDGISGFDLSEKLFEQFNIEDEKTNDISTMLLCGIGTDYKKLQKLRNALKKI